MPVEIEVPTEHLHETIHEAHHEAHGHAEHGGHGGGHAGFTMGVALSSAVLAVLAAMAALFAGHYANDAMLERIEAGDQWSYYQAKGIKSSVMSTRRDVLKALDKPVPPEIDSKLEQYAGDQKKIEEKANEFTEESEAHLTQHTRLAGSVTFFQIAIALGAIAVLTKKRALWMGSLAVGVGGILAMGYGFTKPPMKAAETEAAAEGASGHHEHEGAGHHEGEGHPEAPPAEPAK